ncbi:MAG: YdeI/OmpD-associated family protein [Saprospiraceae bacterium]
MKHPAENRFTATIKIIGINPFVVVPESILKSIIEKAERDKGPIPVQIKLYGLRFVQTLVLYGGDWRLYINTPMLKAARKRVGDEITLSVIFDPIERPNTIHPKLEAAIAANAIAKVKFEELAPSQQKEIIRYINHLKTEDSIARNIQRAIQFLTGEREVFIGREKSKE